MRRPDPDALADRLLALVDDLRADVRTAPFARRLTDIRLDVAEALAAPTPRRIDPGADERARQSAIQGGAALMPRRDYEAAVFAHGGRFAEAGAR